MPLSRRAFLTLAALGGVGCRVRGAARPEGTMDEDRARDATAADGRTLLAYLGTYTTDGGSRGIYPLHVDVRTGALRVGALAAECASPSYLAWGPEGRVLYAVNELTRFADAETGAVSAFARDAATGALAALGAPQPSGGGAPCFVSVDRTGRAVLVANYVGGSVALLPTLAGGALGAPSAVVRHAGRGAHPRQDAPHAHCIVVDPSGRYAVAADLGIDRVRVYRLDAGAGTLASAGEVALPSGAGPRHLAFHPDGRTLYVVNELALTLVAFAWDAGSGTLVERQTVPLLAAPDGMRGSVPRAEWTAADVHVHPSGRFVYASVRGPDVLVVLAVDAASGRLAPVQEIATGGRWPRNFALDASGRLLVVANQRSDDLTSFHVDAATGRLTPTGHRATLAAPVCVRFAPDEAGRE